VALPGQRQQGSVLAILMRTLMLERLALGSVRRVGRMFFVGWEM
jgi:hypothetical protein